MDVAHSFVFNVDTPTPGETYGRYHMRGEPLTPLTESRRLHQAKQEELESLAANFLDPRRLQIIVVGDKTTPVNKESGKVISLEEDLKPLPRNSIFPYTELPLR